MRITVYTKNNCQPCKATKRKLTSAGLDDFQEVNVDEVESAREYLIARGFQASPVVEVVTDRPGVVRTDSWSGFRPDLIEALAADLGVTS